MTEEIRESLPSLPEETVRHTPHEELDEWHERLDREHAARPADPPVAPAPTEQAERPQQDAEDSPPAGVETEASDVPADEG